MNFSTKFDYVMGFDIEMQPNPPLSGEVCGPSEEREWADGHRR